MKKKTGLIIGIIAILIILIGVGAFAFLYFMTDIFKSSRQLFWKYASNSNQLVKMISNENETSQKVWKESHSYTSKGDLSIAVTKETGTKEIKVGTTAKHNQNTGRTYSDMTLYNGEAELLKASYINSGDIYALYCKDIYEPYYIGFRNSDLKELIAKLGIVEDDLGALSLESGLTKEEITYLLETYSSLLVDCIPQEKYTKIDKTAMNMNNQEYQAVGYQLQLNQEDLRKISIDILNKAKEDAQAISILNKMIASTENMDATNSIEQAIMQLQENTLEEINLTITVYNVGKHLTRIQINCNEKLELILDIDDSQEKKQTAILQINYFDFDSEYMGEGDIAKSDIGLRITLEKQLLDNMIIYTTNIFDTQNGDEVTINTSLGNIINNKIENNSKITIFDNDTTVEASYYKTIQEATEEVDVQELTNSSAVIINNYPGDQLEDFFNVISNKIESILPEKIEQLNIQMTDAQDGLYYLEGIAASTFAVMNANGVPQTISATGMTIISGLKQAILMINNGAESSIGNSVTSLAEQEKQVFNQKFEMYKGEEINGTLVKTLLSSTITSNTSYTDDNEKIVKIRLEGNKIKKPEGWSEQGESDATKLSQLSDNIKAGNKYNVVIEYNTKGFVEIITIIEV